jgi:signal peptidase I
MKYAIVIAAVVLALFCRAFLVSVYKVPTQSMAPTILAGDFILATQTSLFKAQIKRGDLVVYTKDYKTFIKRVVAIGFDEVELAHGELSLASLPCHYKMLSSNSDSSLAKYSEDCGDFSAQIVRTSDLKNTFSLQKTRLMDGQYLVLSDNWIFDEKQNSSEIITNDQIIGKPLFIWMSYSSTQDFISESSGLRWNRILTKLQ